MAVVTSVGRLVRRLRWAAHKWSSDSDRAFHDGLYAAQAYDPFTSAYPGNITIRRFADHAASWIQPSFRRIVDIGCGPGEITCELARRFPAAQFDGFDHSEVAIARARGNARRLGLENVVFTAGDALDVPDEPFDLALIFDAFHHITDPARFVARLRERCPRVFLIEPAGTWEGRWQRDLELDWMLTEVEKVRARFAATIAEPEPAAAAGVAAPDSRGEAVERRYAFDDLERFFTGFTLHVRGTVAGVDAYPPNPYARSRTRERFGEFLYERFRDADEALFRTGRDFAAKHWCIYASLVDGTRRVPSAVEARTPGGDAVTGAFDVEWGPYAGPQDAAPDQELIVEVELTNRGWQTWRSDVAASPVMLSYHWLDARGAVLAEGLRTALPRPLAAGERCRAAMRVRTPSRPGSYRLAIDLVQEGVTWFSAAGHPPLTVRVRIA